MVATLGALGSILLSQISAKPGGYLLRVKYQPGTKIRYVIESKVEGAGKILIPQTLAIRDIPKGIANVVVMVGSPTLNGQSLAPEQSFPMRLTNQNEPVGGGFPSTVTVSYPTRAVKIGESWSASVPFAPFSLLGVSGEQGEAKTTYRLTGFKGTGKERVALIGLTVTGSVSGSGSFRIRASDGILLSADFKLKVRFQSPQPVAVNLQVRKT